MSGAAGYLVPYNTWAADLSDKGNDPDFRQVPYSWGICRPNIRRSVAVGQYLFFVARDKGGTHGFFIKGYFRVAKKLTLPEVLRQPILRGRQNVLLDNFEPAGDVHAAIQSYVSDGKVCWNPAFVSAENKQFGGEFDGKDVGLYAFEDRGRWFVHNREDDHCRDDWRCNRLFRCRRTDFQACANGAVCPRRARLSLDDLPSYVVGDITDCSVIETRIPWASVVDCLGETYDRLLRRCLVPRRKADRDTKDYAEIRGQSNAVKMSQCEVDGLRSFLNDHARRAAGSAAA
jgi:hypothetical protein